MGPSHVQEARHDKHNSVAANSAHESQGYTLGPDAYESCECLTDSERLFCKLGTQVVNGNCQQSGANLDLRRGVTIRMECRGYSFGFPISTKKTWCSASMSGHCLVVYIRLARRAGDWKDLNMCESERHESGSGSAHDMQPGSQNEPEL